MRTTELEETQLVHKKKRRGTQSGTCIQRLAKKYKEGAV